MAEYEEGTQPMYAEVLAPAAILSQAARQEGQQGGVIQQCSYVLHSPEQDPNVGGGRCFHSEVVTVQVLLRAPWRSGARMYT